MVTPNAVTEFVFEFMMRPNSNSQGIRWNKPKNRSGLALIDDLSTFRTRQQIARREAEDVGVMSSKKYACSKAADGKSKPGFGLIPLAEIIVLVGGAILPPVPFRRRCQPLLGSR